MATEDRFQHFLRNQSSKSKDVGNLSDRKDAWLKQVDCLYQRVLGLLAPHLSSGGITSEFVAISVSEELLGSYEMQSLVLNLGASKILFRPIGTYLIGSPGRVDMNGLRSSVRFVLTPPDAVAPVFTITTSAFPKREKPSPTLEIHDFVWKISSNPPRIKYTEITRDSLEKAIIEAAGG